MLPGIAITGRPHLYLVYPQPLQFTKYKNSPNRTFSETADLMKKLKLKHPRLVSCDENFAKEMRSISSLMVLLEFALKPQKGMKREPRFRFKFSHLSTKAQCQPIGFCHILGTKFSFRVCQNVNAWKRCIWDGYSMSSLESANVSGTDCSFCDTNSTKKVHQREKVHNMQQKWPVWCIQYICSSR